MAWLAWHGQPSSHARQRALPPTQTHPVTPGNRYGKDFPDVTLCDYHCEFSKISRYHSRLQPLLVFPDLPGVTLPPGSYWPRATGASAAGGICGQITFCRAGSSLLQRILTWPKHFWNMRKIDLCTKQIYPRPYRRYVRLGRIFYNIGEFQDISKMLNLTLKVIRYHMKLNLHKVCLP